MQIYDDLIYGAAELLQDRATFLSSFYVIPFIRRRRGRKGSFVVPKEKKKEKKEKEKRNDWNVITVDDCIPLTREKGREQVIY